MTGDATDPPELTAEDPLVLDDDRFAPGTVAIVTGAASGIGRATTAVLAANGLTVLATDIDEEGLAGTRDLVEEIDAPGPVETLVADLTDDAALARIVEGAADLGNVTFLANIAGMQHIDPIEEFPTDTYDVMHRVMLRAPLVLSKLALPHMRDREDGVGAVGNMCSIHGHVATQDKVGYVTSKFGLRGLTKSIAAEGDGSIRAFTVSTGYVKTPLVTEQIPDTADERGLSEREVVEDVMLGQSRVKEMMEPVEVANLFALGFSEHGRHLTGADLTWDGGQLSTYE